MKASLATGRLRLYWCAGMAELLRPEAEGQYQAVGNHTGSGNSKPYAYSKEPCRMPPAIGPIIMPTDMAMLYNA